MKTTQEKPKIYGVNLIPLGSSIPEVLAECYQKILSRDAPYNGSSMALHKRNAGRHEPKAEPRGLPSKIDLMIMMYEHGASNRQHRKVPVSAVFEKKNGVLTDEGMQQVREDILANIFGKVAETGKYIGRDWTYSSTNTADGVTRQKVTRTPAGALETLGHAPVEHIIEKSA